MAGPELFVCLQTQRAIRSAICSHCSNGSVPARLSLPCNVRGCSSPSALGTAPRGTPGALAASPGQVRVASMSQCTNLVTLGTAGGAEQPHAALTPVKSQCLAFIYFYLFLYLLEGGCNKHSLTNRAALPPSQLSLCSSQTGLCLLSQQLCGGHRDHHNPALPKTTARDVLGGQNHMAKLVEKGPEETEPMCSVSWAGEQPAVTSCRKTFCQSHRMDKPGPHSCWVF